MLNVMDRHNDWAVIIALIGNGQEINTGEAGLGEWGRALLQGFRHWKVLVSSRLATEAAAGIADSLFRSVPEDINVIQESNLDLVVSQRSYKAQAVSEFVAHLLLMEIDEAKAKLEQCGEFPIIMTRDLHKAREWLREKQRGSRRIGLVASSGGRRLKAHGLDVRSELDVENWFLNPMTDVRSSFSLETPATEFGVQGLELDWVGLCWDLDLVPEDGQWKVQAFRGTKWQSVNNVTRRQYVLNKYRALLTRAREGMMIWIPEGNADDGTRPSRSYNAIAEYLTKCGVSHSAEITS